MLTKEDNELLTHTGPGTPMGELFRRFWMPALISDELSHPDCAPLRIKLLGEDLVAFRDSEGQVGVVDAYCPHRRSRLYFGRNEESGLRCLYHGWKFDVAGNCVDMPSEPPESTFKDKVRIKSYPTREWGGVIWTYMGPLGLMPELPLFEWCQVPPSHRSVSRWIQECNYFQGMEGEMDSTHAFFLHQWFDGRQMQPSGPGGARGGHAGGGRPNFVFNSVQITPRQTDFGMIRSSHSHEAEGLRRWRIDRWMIPIFSLISASSYPVGGRCFVPIDDEHVTVFQYVSHPERPLTDDELRRLGPNAPDEKKYTPTLERAAYHLPGGYAIDTWRDQLNLQNDYLQDREFQRTRNMSGVPSQRTQDTVMVERQGDGPIAERYLERLGSTDAPLIKMRQILIDAARDLQRGIEPKNTRHPEHFSTVAIEVVSPHTELDPALQEVEAILRSHSRPWKVGDPATASVL
ncbi:MAG: Rieske 2Fe-2S domain-containing protein [Chloroflexi bacterium]|nr:Rieske 2Fe-2S domain-containing protein [Chloroflexota bacterium]